MHNNHHRKQYWHFFLDLLPLHEVHVEQVQFERRSTVEKVDHYDLINFPDSEVGRLTLEEHPAETDKRCGHLQQETGHTKKVCLFGVPDSNAVTHKTQEVVDEEKGIEETKKHKGREQRYALERVKSDGHVSDNEGGDVASVHDIFAKHVVEEYVPNCRGSRDNTKHSTNKQETPVDSILRRQPSRESLDEEEREDVGETEEEEEAEASCSCYCDNGLETRHGDML